MDVEVAVRVLYYVGEAVPVRIEVFYLFVRLYLQYLFLLSCLAYNNSIYTVLILAKELIPALQPQIIINHLK